MYIFYGSHTLSYWLSHEEGRMYIQTYSMKIWCKTKHTEHFKSKQQKAFISFNSVTTLLILQTFSNPLQPMSLLPIILIFNLTYNC